MKHISEPPKAFRETDAGLHPECFVKKWSGTFFLLGLALAALPAVAFGTAAAEDGMDGNRFLTDSVQVRDMVNHPAFAGFGEHLLPRPQDAHSALPLRDVGRLMPWHGHVRPDVVLTALNRMIADVSAGQTVFYSFYADEQKRERTGLFYFRGKPGAPFALICPGGGFAYVGSLQEGFPLAETLSRQGYNAFVLQYRTGGGAIACEDAAAALTWIFDHADELDVATSGYSIWGGSAGARVAADMGSYGAEAFGGGDIPRPAAVVMAYTGHDRSTKNDPPTFATVSADDPIASPRTMERRIEALKQAGIATEFHRYRHAGHGFGTGAGTDAEGWMEHAIRFWERQLREER